MALFLTSEHDESKQEHQRTPVTPPPSFLCADYDPVQYSPITPHTAPVAQTSSDDFCANLPTAPQLLLLTLDYLRDLRRSYSAQPDDLQLAEGIDSDYITVAIWALSRAFLKPKQLAHFKDASENSWRSSHGRGNDAWFSVEQNFTNDNADGIISETSSKSDKWYMLSNDIKIPSLEEMQREVLYDRNPKWQERHDNRRRHQHEDEEIELAEDRSTWYEYDDAHYSNLHRFYPLNGLASTPAIRGPLTLDEIAAAGLIGLGARTRQDAEEEMIQSPLFDQFLRAVKAKGFFDNLDGNEPIESNSPLKGGKSELNGVYAGNTAATLPTRVTEEERDQRINAAYEERYRKVVAKFRSKLAARAEQQTAATRSARASRGDSVFRSPLEAVNPADHTQRHNDGSNGNVDSVDEKSKTMKTIKTEMMHSPQASACKKMLNGRSGGTLQSFDNEFSKAKTQKQSVTPSIDPPPLLQELLRAQHDKACDDRDDDRSFGTIETDSTIHQQDLEEAERLKSTGNAYMQKKDYAKAANAYTFALKLCPTGPNSHVYFSNRAAALLSMKQFKDAILDSERSLALKPDYGKAHARLGLSLFLLGNYKEAIEAYEFAVHYEPENKTSRGYLSKARKKWQAEQDAAARMEGGQQRENQPLSGDGSASTELTANTKETADVRSVGSKKHQSGVRSDSRGRSLRKFDGEMSLSGSSSGKGSSRPPPSDPEERRRAINNKAAEKLKSKGNAHMAAKEFDHAVNAYSEAIRLNPTGSHSHVYYSNRAAALCYLERYEDAEFDSERSLSLKPDFAKAHARLGLSRYFLRDYEGAVEAYENALLFDPTNAASKGYLAKAQAKLSRWNDDDGTVYTEGEYSLESIKSMPPPPPPAGLPKGKKPRS